MIILTVNCEAVAKYVILKIVVILNRKSSYNNNVYYYVNIGLLIISVNHFELSIPFTAFILNDLLSKL